VWLYIYTFHTVSEATFFSLHYRPSLHPYIWQWCIHSKFNLQMLLSVLLQVCFFIFGSDMLLFFFLSSAWYSIFWICGYVQNLVKISNDIFVLAVYIVTTYLLFFSFSCASEPCMFSVFIFLVLSCHMFVIRKLKIHEQYIVHVHVFSKDIHSQLIQRIGLLHLYFWMGIHAFALLEYVA
jgi:hypothetical protein